MISLSKKYTVLRRKILNLRAAVIAFSGGTDSSVLAKIVFDCLGKNAIAVTAKSATYSSADLKEATKTAKLIGIRHIIIKTNEFKNKKFISNSPGRCYWCKRELFIKLKALAGKYKIKNILDGTNKDDCFDVRPGFAANKEFNIMSPFLECGLTKADIKKLAGKLNIRQKSPNACLASRIPFCEKITPEKLAKIERAENILREYLGDKNILRARDHGNILRIEIENKQWTKLGNSGINNLIKKLKKIGYKYITIDLEGYIPAGLR
ncbi:MAG: ATP-dependent sacrificial sulfur transferase LarE [Candidatus Omnitrophica bacterium]|nr:ATP-dependent sacrificial sulfur transferase LarE [Candidatus Omnitrophota bacterium]